MTKHEAIEFIAQRTGLQKNQVEEVVNLFIERIKYSLMKGDKVHLRRFGNFTNVKRATKKGRDISRNKEVIIEGHLKPVFKPSKNLTELINGKKINVKR
jgi:DNA-binding protein HU-beta